MHVPEIIEVKDKLNEMLEQNLIEAWELPYENLLTRRDAAIFFLTPHESVKGQLELIWNQLKKFDHFNFRENTEKELSTLAFRVTFVQNETIEDKTKDVNSFAE